MKILVANNCVPFVHGGAEHLADARHARGEADPLADDLGHVDAADRAAMDAKVRFVAEDVFVSL